METSFLIEHDRHGRIPTRITAYHDAERAEQALTGLDLPQMPELRKKTLNDPPLRMEYLIINTKSPEMLEEMYPRFFWTPAGFVWNEPDHRPADPEHGQPAPDPKRRQPTPQPTP